MSGHNVRPGTAVVGQLGNMHGKCLMSDRYFELCINLTVFTMTRVDNGTWNVVWYVIFGHRPHTTVRASCHMYLML